MKSFLYTVNSLRHWSKLKTKEPLKTISKKEYEKFCKDFIFEKLKGVSFGKAFCDRFDFDHFIIESLPDESAKGFIEKHGYVK